MCHAIKITFDKPPRDNRADWREVCLRECENECVCAHYDFLQPAFENSNTSLCSSGSQISRAWVSAGHNMRAHTQSCGSLMTPHTVTTHTLTQIPQNWTISLNCSLTGRNARGLMRKDLCRHDDDSNMLGQRLCFIKPLRLSEMLHLSISFMCCCLNEGGGAAYIRTPHSLPHSPL